MELQAELDAYAAGMQSAGQCTLEDEAEMKKLGGGSGEGSFPKVLADCGRKAYSWFRWKRDKMEKCVRKAAKISAPCTKCFSASTMLTPKRAWVLTWMCRSLMS